MSHPLSIKTLVRQYTNALSALRKAKVIRSANVIGDLGEWYAIDHYTRTLSKPTLTQAPPSTKAHDAVDRRTGAKYAIKTVRVSSKTTGVFYGISTTNSKMHCRQVFDYLIIVVLSDSLTVQSIYELPWDEFKKNMKWHSRMMAWNVTVTKRLTSFRLPGF
jgi:hypothetical protein